VRKGRPGLDRVIWPKRFASHEAFDDQSARGPLFTIEAGDPLRRSELSSLFVALAKLNDQALCGCLRQANLEFLNDLVIGTSQVKQRRNVHRKIDQCNV
jgi:hypothetical protein